MRVHWILLAALLFPGCLHAQSGERPAPAREKNRAASARIDAENAKAHGKNPDVLLCPGLMADRKAQRVVITAETTDVGANDPIEYLIIGEKSGHNYEAFTVSFASPGDVRKGLEFIGMAAGRPPDPKTLNFWPKGERVLPTLSWETADGKTKSLRMEEMIRVRDTGKPLAKSGLVFTGSRMVPYHADESKLVFAADTYSPYSIAANYNEPNSVLDVPRPAPQASVYERQFPNMDARPPSNHLVRIRLEPEYKDGKKRVMDLVLQVDMTPEAAPGKANSKETTRETTPLARLRFALLAPGGEAKLSAVDMNPLLKELVDLKNKGHDPYLTLKLRDTPTLEALNQFALLLSTIDAEQGARIEAPTPGQLFYKAFMPNEEYRQRQNRHAQPWELRLARADGKVTGVLTDIELDWPENQLRPNYIPTDYPVASPEELRKTLDDDARRKKELGKESSLAVLLVFAPNQMTYGELMSFIRPAMSTHPMIHVYVEKPTVPEPAKTPAPGPEAPAAP